MVAQAVIDSKLVPKRFSEKSFQIFKRDVLTFGAQIITGAVVARVLGPGAMGLWIILQMIPSYAEVIGRVHADTASVYILGNGKHRLGEVAFAVVMVALLSAGVTVGVFLWQQHWLFASFLRQVAGIKPLVYLMLAYLPLRFLVISYSYLLLSQDDVYGYNALTVLTNLAPAVLGAILVLVTPFGILGLILSTIIGGAAALVYGTRRIHAREPMIVHHDLRLAVALLSFGLRLYLVSTVSYLHLYVSGLLVTLYVPASQVAFFRMGQDRALLLTKIPGAVSPLLYPRVVRLAENPREASALAATSFRLTLLLLVALGAVGVVVAKPAVFVLYGRAFDSIVLPLLILIPGVVADASSALLTQYYVGRGRLWIILGMAIIGVLLQVGLLVFSLPRWGILGAAAATSCSYLVTMVMRVAVFSRVEGVALRDLLRPRRDDVAFLWRFVSTRLQLTWRPIAGALLKR